LGARGAAGAVVDGRVRIMLELTERALFTQPAELMRTILAARRRGWGVALDDVGGDPASLAMLPFVDPDVIKLDLSLIHRTPSAAQAHTMTAVLAHVERTGATVLAEGIETGEQVEQARAFGATLGQGWYFGPPDALPVESGTGRHIPFARGGGPTPRTPFDLVADHAARRTADRKTLLAFSRRLEDHAVNLVSPPVVLGAFQSADRFTSAVQRRYERIARDCPMVGALAVDLPARPANGVRGGRLEPDDPLADEWTVVVVGDHYTGALIARERGGAGPDADPRFDYVLTHDRDLVLAAGRSLLDRLLPAGANA
jgi:hypothetical protein